MQQVMNRSTCSTIFDGAAATDGACSEDEEVTNKPAKKARIVWPPSVDFRAGLVSPVSYLVHDILVCDLS